MIRLDMSSVAEGGKKMIKEILVWTGIGCFLVVGLLTPDIKTRMLAVLYAIANGIIFL